MLFLPRLRLIYISNGVLLVFEQLKGYLRRIHWHKSKNATFFNQSTVVILWRESLITGQNQLIQ